LVWGEAACFTRPEMKVERVSYEVMTPGAARGILEAILWKPALRWIIKEIDVLRPLRWGRVDQDQANWDRLALAAVGSPVRFASVRRNEVGCVFSAKDGFFVEDNRQQRAGLILRDVAYLIQAEFALTERAGPEDTAAKFSEMFRRRAGRGQSYHRPYLGCREFEAHFSLLDFDEPQPEPIPESRDLGFMFYDFDYGQGRTARFFRASLDEGRMLVPNWDSPEVRS
jgi:CRISPR-associated protein Cas5d